MAKTRVKCITTHLDKLYKKNDTLSKFHVLKSFKTYKQPSTLSIPEYTDKFEKHLHKVKNYAADMSDDILAYQFLKNTYLKKSKARLIKVTITDLRYNLMNN